MATKRARAAHLHDHEESIRRILGEKDYTALVRHLSATVRLLAKLEQADARIRLNPRSRRVKVPAPLTDEARRALEALAEHLADAVQPIHVEPTPTVRRPTLLRVVARRPR